MGYRYAIIGSGRQGTAAAYDLGKLGEADFLLMADADHQQASQAAKRVNELLGADLAEPQTLDAGEDGSAIQGHGLLIGDADAMTLLGEQSRGGQGTEASGG